MSTRGKSKFGTFQVFCAVCGEPFEAGYPTALTCKNACRQILKRWRAADRRRTRDAHQTLDGVYDMYRRGLSPHGLEELASLRNHINQIEADAKARGYGFPRPLLFAATKGE